MRVKGCRVVKGPVGCLPKKGLDGWEIGYSEQITKLIDLTTMADVSVSLYISILVTHILRLCCQMHMLSVLVLSSEYIASFSSI